MWGRGASGSRCRLVTSKLERRKEIDWQRNEAWEWELTRKFQWHHKTEAGGDHSIRRVGAGIARLMERWHSSRQWGQKVFYGYRATRGAQERIGSFTSSVPKMESDLQQASSAVWSTLHTQDWPGGGFPPRKVSFPVTSWGVSALKKESRQPYRRNREKLDESELGTTSELPKAQIKPA